MEKKYSGQVPEKVERYASYRVLNYNVRETTEAEVLEQWGYSNEEGDFPSEDFVERHKYVYYTLSIPTTKWSYGGIVNAIIREKYTIDEMEAITNNMAAINAVFMQTLVSGGIVEAVKYLRESADSDDTEAFKAMQEWRTLAKKEAKEVLGL